MLASAMVAGGTPVRPRRLSYLDRQRLVNGILFKLVVFGSLLRKETVDRRTFRPCGYPKLRSDHQSRRALLPSSGRTAPVIQELSAEQRNRAASATSRGFPLRPRGCSGRNLSYDAVTCWAEKMPLPSSVSSTMPGQITLTRIPSPASSSAMTCDIIIRAAFDMQEAPLLSKGRMPEIEDTFTIEPPPRCRMRGSSDTERRHGAADAAPPARDHSRAPFQPSHRTPLPAFARQGYCPSGGRADHGRTRLRLPEARRGEQDSLGSVSGGCKKSQRPSPRAHRHEGRALKLLGIMDREEEEMALGI